MSNRAKRILSVAAVALTVAATAVVGWFIRRWSFPVRKREVEVDSVSAEPPPIPAEMDAIDEPLFLTREGTGPLFYRRYRADIANPTLSAETLMQQIQQDINDFCPGELAQFEKITGSPDGLHAGDEYYITISGPWNGHVRTVDVTPTSFGFATLREHMECGEITFNLQPHPDRPNAQRFEIRSWARSQDDLVAFTYETLGVAKFAQESLWAYFCNAVAEASDGELIGEIDVRTEKAPYRGEVIPQKETPLWEQHKARFERFREAQVNYDPDQQHEYTEAQGWRIDDYSVELVPEAPGAPAENGSWRAAQEVIRNYEFPDPNIVTGIFVPDDPLDQRIMILRARFLWFTFFFGARISQVIDEVREQDGEAVHVWGYSYQTLEDHFEMGEITFAVWKYADSGKVEFRINAYSKTAHIPNIFYRIGFRLFGRGLQKRFAYSALERMVRFVEERTGPHPKGDEPSPSPRVQSTSADPSAEDALEDAQESGG